MRVATAFAVLLPLVSYALAGPASVIRTKCEFYNSGADKSLWRDQGTLEINISKPLEYERRAYKTIRREKNQGMSSPTNYIYTLSAGIGWFETRAKGPNDTNELYVQAERQYGKGLGQKFRCQFGNKNNAAGPPLLDIVLYANQRCQMGSPFSIDHVSEVTLFAEM